MHRRVALIVGGFWLLGSCLAAAGPVTSKPDPVRGKSLAERVCSNCHLVSAEQKQANVDVPSFQEIANKTGQTAGAIMAHIVLPKHPMPTIPLTKSELADLAAYIMNLRDPGERLNP
ncbi:MAG TPA: c-type cytochrome [Methyloceanibacter sp.]|nr:c-type cytochrome [Methyloceanibacter sp.]